MNSLKRFLVAFLVCALFLSESNTLILRAEEANAQEAGGSPGISEAGLEANNPPSEPGSEEKGEESGTKQETPTDTISPSLPSQDEAPAETGGNPAGDTSEPEGEEASLPVPAKTEDPEPSPAGKEEVSEPVVTPEPTGTPENEESLDPEPVITPEPAPAEEQGPLEPLVTPEPLEPLVTPEPIEPSVTPEPVPSPAPQSETGGNTPGLPSETQENTVPGENGESLSGDPSQNNPAAGETESDGTIKITEEDEEKAKEFNDELTEIETGNVDWNSSDGGIKAEFTLPADSSKDDLYKQFKVVLTEYSDNNPEGIKVAGFNDTIGDLMGEKTFETHSFNGVSYYLFSFELSKPLRENGVSAFYTFKLSYTQDGNTIESRESDRLEYVYEANKLDNPTGLKWESGKKSATGYALWEAVENASGYRVKLYKNDRLIDTVETGASETRVLILEEALEMTPEELSQYCFSVTAIGKGRYADSEEIKSGVVSGILPAPGGLEWVGTVATWDAVDNAYYYNVRLLKSKVEERDKKKRTFTEIKKVQILASEERKVDFLSKLKDLDDKEIKKHDYCFEVVACPENGTFLEKSEPALSDPYTTAARISNLEWASDTGEVSFRVNDYFGTYKLVFYRDGKKIGTETLGNLQGMLIDGRYYFPADNYLKQSGRYEVRVVDTRSDQYLAVSMKFKQPSPTNRITAPKIKKSHGSNTIIEWEPSKHTESNTGITYEIKLFDSKRSVEIRTVNCYYDLVDEMIRTGLKKVKVRAISDDLQAIGSSDWSNELKLKQKTDNLNVSGECGSAATYKLEGKKGSLTLVIEGEGSMTNYSNPAMASSDNVAPWAEYSGQIKKLTIAPGITSIGDYAFYGCRSISSVTLPAALTSIGNYAFYGCTALSGKLIIPAGVTKIGEGAFFKDKKLNMIMFEGGTEPIVTGYTNKSSNASFSKGVKISINNEELWESARNQKKWQGYKIYSKPVKVEKITLSENICNLGTKEAVKLEAEISPSYAGDKTIIWKSSDESIVKVSSNGKVTSGTKSGMATVTAISKANRKARAVCTFVVGEKNTWIKKDGYYYYTNGKGETVTGWARATIYGNKDNKKKYYQFFDRKTGRRRTGWVDDGEYRYYLKSDGTLLTGYKKLQGKWYCFNNDNSLTPEEGYGAMKTGWDEPAYGRYFRAVSGEAVTGWCQIEGQWYYFDNNGNKLTGARKIGGKIYYLKDTVNTENGETLKNTGAKQYGEVTSGDGKHYLLSGRNTNPRNETLNGAAVTGWFEDRQYYDPATGVRASGFYEVKTINRSEYYYFDEATGNKVVNDTRYVGGEEFRFGPTGLLATGGIATSKKKYYDYDSNGKLRAKRDVISYNGRMYYDNDGTWEVIYGIACIDGKYFYYDVNGERPSGTIFVAADKKTETTDPDEIMYCFTMNGRKTGWVKDADKNKYYFRPKTGEKLTGTQCVGNIWYNFGEDGIKSESSRKEYATITSLNYSNYDKDYDVAASFYKDGKLKDAWHTTGKNKWYPTGLFEFSFDSQSEPRIMYLENGKPKTGWVTSSLVSKGKTRKFYFFQNSGEMATGKTTISSRKYYFYTLADEMENNGKVVQGELAVSAWLGNTMPDCSGPNKVWQSIPNTSNTARTFRYVKQDGTFVSGWLEVKKDNTKTYYYFDPSPADPAMKLTLSRNTRVENGKYFVDEYGRRK